MSRRLFAAGLIATLTAVAVAQQPRPALDDVFKRFDANKDGKLSRAEFEKFAEFAPRLKGENKDAADALFKRLDAKSNGFLTLEEFKKLGEMLPRPDGLKKGPFGKFKEKESPKPAVVEEKPATAEQIAFFEKKIRPVLVDKCYSCHAEDTKKGAKGGLLVTTRDGLRKGGDSGPAVVPGNSRSSLLIKALKGDGAEAMPPKEKLSADVIADFEAWVKMGAPDPRTGKAVAKKGETIDIEKGKQHWAFQPPRKPDAAATIDSLVQAKLREKHLTPNPEADRRTLIRRVYFDLVGLPPTPQQVEAFLADRSPTAFEKVVDELLGSPAFGERWGRHWLDVARFAESSGKEQNVLYPFAWRYRDYVIASFNADKPYNEFLREQLAGDLLGAKSDAEKAEHLIATGFLAVGPKSHNERNPLQFRLDLADEQIDAFSQAMLGLTVACARCHDHKFDPIPQRDYYALAGIFTSTETKFGTPRGLQGRQNVTPLAELPKDAPLPTGAMLSKREVENLRERLTTLKKQREDAIAEARKDGQAPVRLVIVANQIATIEEQLSHFDADGNPKKLAMAAGDRTFPRDSPVYTRGEPDKPGDVVPRGFLQVLGGGSKIRSGSGRKELADWVASKDNPLTARVMANRVWLHLFGRGIVASPDNFGTTGQAPSHPELLDFLALSLVENGWSVKKLVRSVVLSKTYRLSSDHSTANAAVDPDNVYQWRMSKRRLDAEVIRDAMYAVAGQLDKAPAVGSPVSRFEGPTQVLRFGGIDRLFDTTHRSVYLPVVRDNVPEVLALFDFAEPSLVTGNREDTSVPSQGLFLMNNPQVMKLAEKTAERLIKDYLSPSERIDAAFRLAFGRPPTSDEAKAADAFVKRFGETKTTKATWAAFSQALFAAAEFRYVD